MISSVLKGWGHALPTGRITNEDLSKLLGLGPQEIFEKTGIRSRAQVKSETVIDLAKEASLSALKKSGLTMKEIDLIVLAISVPAQPMPATANLLQRELGGSSCMCFDINASCTGFKYGLNIVDGMIRSGMIRNALLVGADLGTKMVDYRKSGPSIIFGDGAGAFIFTSGTEGGLLAHADRTQSEYSHEITIEVGGSLRPVQNELLESEGRFISMNGPRVFAQAVSQMSSLCEEVCAKAGVKLSDVDWVVPHQANFRILEAVGWKLTLSSERIIVDLEDIGNTAAGTLPIAFSRAEASGKIRKGQLVLFVSFAAGFSGGATLMRF